MNKVIVLAPHTDDGELGCGGTIAKLCSENKDIFYIAFSTCRRSLPAGWEPDTLEIEVRNATRVLGIKPENLIILDYDVRVFPENRQKILEDLVYYNKQIQPDTIFMPSVRDIHQDHNTIAMEGIRAFKTHTILGYEMPWNNLSFNTSAFVILNEDHIETKSNALMEYKSQLHRPYINRDFIYSMAKIRGVQIGEKYAESFEMIRAIY
ncbi:MAG: PIG-L family deacetylase [Chitinophagaceae bacterium]|nr:PIG-L family deacetylase [Chitinophagaceae bacterium]